MAIDKPDLTRIWAKDAPVDNIVDPDTTTPGKFANGWQAEVPPFEHFNFIQKLQTQGLAYINQQGVPVWDADTVYPLNAIVKGSDGKLYKSLSEQSGNNPTSTSGFWSSYDFSDRVIRVNDVSDLSNIDASEGFQASVKDKYLYVYESGAWREQTVDTRTGVKTLEETFNSRVSILESDIEIRVPTDFPTIQEAIESTIGIVLNGSTSPAITIRLEAGFIISQTTNLRYANYSNVNIVSDDIDVSVSGLADTDNLFDLRDCMGPKFSILVDANGVGGHGIYLDNSRISINDSCGVKRAGYFGLYANKNSIVTCGDDVDFSEAGSNNSTESQSDATGMSARRCSFIYCGDSPIVENSLRYGISASDSSKILCKNAKARNCGRHGIRADEASEVSCSGSTVRFAGAFGIYALRGSTITCHNSDANACGEKGIYAAQGSTIDCQGSTSSNHTATGATGIQSISGSVINAEDCEANNNDGEGVFAVKGSTINFHNGESIGGGTPHLRVSGGGIINASGANYADASKVENNLTSTGIIFA